MAIDKPLTAFFGPGATQDATTITILKADLVSTRTPLGFIGLTATANNTSESMVAALILKLNEQQDTSTDAQFAIFPQGVSIVNEISDGVSKPFNQYVYTIRFLEPRGMETPNPNLI
jgi:hypothetical protein